MTTLCDTADVSDQVAGALAGEEAARLAIELAHEKSQRQKAENDFEVRLLWNPWSLHPRQSLNSLHSILLVLEHCFTSSQVELHS